MLEGLFPYLKRAIPIALVWCAFFVGVQFAFAQGGGADSGQVGSNPNFPIGGPGTFPVPGGPTNPITPITGTDGSGIGGSRADTGDIPANTETVSQTEELPVIEVDDSPTCFSSAKGFLNCLVVSFFGSLVAIAGYTFDSAISLFIVGFGDLYINAGIGYTVENVWETIRDVFNLTFIFGLVYIGFQIILGTNESGAKRTIPLLILAALLVNFSLFVVKFIIDFANLAAVQVYNLFMVGEEIDNRTPTGGIVDLLTASDGPSIALAFMNSIGVSGLLNNNVAGGPEGAPIMYTFIMIIIFLVLTYVFFAGAILITIRFAVLIFYMIFSPVMFLGWVFPGLKSYSDKFWDGLFGQAFFAPALLFMLYISYRLTVGFNNGQRSGVDAVGDIQNNISAYAQFMPYLVVVVIFLLGSLIISKKMASQGADMVGKINDWAVGKASALTGSLAGGTTAGVAARVGRNTVGVGAYALQNSEGFKDMMARSGRFGKMMYGGVSKVADSSFDARKVGGVGKKMNIGSGRKGGIATILKEEKESDEKFLKTIGVKEWKRGKFEDSDEAIRLNKIIATLTQGMEGVTDESQLDHMKNQIAVYKKEYADRNKDWESEESKYIYDRQLNYINSMERWQKMQKSGATGILVGTAAIASAGFLPTVVGTIATGAGIGGAISSRGYWYTSKKAAADLRKDYGLDGSKKKKSDQKKKAQEEAAAALGMKKDDNDHSKKDIVKEQHHDALKAIPAASKTTNKSAGSEHNNSGSHHH